MSKVNDTTTTRLARRGLLGAAGAILAAAGSTPAGAMSAGAMSGPAPTSSSYLTLNPTQQAAFDKLHAIVTAQADGTWVEPSNPDAALFALCAEYHRLDRAGHDEANLAWEQDHAEAWTIHERLGNMTPVTEAGHRAKAQVAIALLAMFHEGQEGGDPEAVFALGTLRGWLGIAA